MLGLPKLEAANLDGQWIPGHLPDLAVLLRSAAICCPAYQGYSSSSRNARHARNSRKT